jgi:Rrf2 family protein
VAFRAKTAYGLVALLELAAVHPAGGVLRAAEIAARQGIPERYLEQMLASLRRGGILLSLRGPRGGYRLARPPEAISVAEVVACLEGEMASERRADPGTPEFSVVAGLEAALERRRQELLAARSIDQLLRERRMLGDAPVMYFI